MDWLIQLDLSAEVRQMFLTYLLSLYHQCGEHQHFRKERLRHIHIPIVQNEGRIPESMDFAQLAQSLGSSVASVRIELMQYYGEFRHERRAKNALNRCRATILSTAQLGASLGLSAQQVRHLARKNQIKGAVKQGRYWRFFQTA